MTLCVGEGAKIPLANGREFSDLLPNEGVFTEYLPLRTGKMAYPIECIQVLTRVYARLKDLNYTILL